MKNKKNTIDKPHDKALFKALANHDVARDAMRAYLPDELLSMTTLENIRLYKTKLVSPEFKQIVLYTGEAPYNESLDVFDFFGEHKVLAKKYPPSNLNSKSVGLYAP